MFFLVYAINIVVQCFLFILTVLFPNHLFIWMRAPVPSDMSKRNLSANKCKQDLAVCVLPVGQAMVPQN